MTVPTPAFACPDTPRSMVRDLAFALGLVGSVGLAFAPVDAEAAESGVDRVVDCSGDARVCALAAGVARVVGPSVDGAPLAPYAHEEDFDLDRGESVMVVCPVEAPHLVRCWSESMLVEVEEVDGERCRAVCDDASIDHCIGTLEADCR